MAELKLEHIKKTYDNNNTVVKDFNLHITDKEFIVFVGPSGCGKSTTLRMVAGLESITSGDFYIDGERMNDVEPKNRDIAMVFQNYALYPHMTVFENMAFGLKLRKVNKKEIEQKVNEAAEILGLTEYLGRKPKALSGGQRQLSNLDAKLRVQMRTEILKLHKRLNTTTIYVTHDQTEALTMASRIVVLKDGDIMQVGTPREIYDAPNCIFVAQFIGSPAMNMLNATVEMDGLKVGTHHFKLHNKKFEKLKAAGYLDKEIILGIRAEDIHEEPIFIQTSPETQFESEVVVSELLGSEIMVHSTFQGMELISKLDSRTQVMTNDKITLAFDMNKCHFFDEKTGNRIV
ncbi:TPA: ATP-binding cassette domain-containing protein [Staphylococcus aureus]|nr:ATP-binding cassette domain-containing protein [Staphylococcus aureus]HCV1210758.1 ATP-binding cassette domain-containing protein [Staphylococcus aureus]HEP1204713.1 ATP-binding cassette domain-containing protein [Staphylococcus aureus]